MRNERHTGSGSGNMLFFVRETGNERSLLILKGFSSCLLVIHALTVLRVISRRSKRDMVTPSLLLSLPLAFG